MKDIARYCTVLIGTLFQVLRSEFKSLTIHAYFESLAVQFCNATSYICMTVFRDLLVLLYLLFSIYSIHLKTQQQMTNSRVF